jgi:hypothetical protein
MMIFPSNTKKKLFNLFFALLLLLSPLFASILACALPGSADESTVQTVIAQNVQATVNAEDAATLQARQTSLAVNETKLALQLEGTVQAQQATLQAQETRVALEKTKPPTPSEASATQTQEGSSKTFDSVSLVNWDQNYFVPISTGCPVEDSPCWKADDDSDKHFGGTLSLVCEDTVFIDPEWPNPYLVFWHKYDLARPANVSILFNSQWEYLKIYGKGQSNWSQDAFDLSKYKGDTILIQFSTDGRAPYVWPHPAPPKNDWYIQYVQIVPDYAPEP